MQKITGIFRIFVSAITLVILLSGCGGQGKLSNQRIGMIGVKTPGRMNYKFQTFTGDERSQLALDKGQTLQISYQVTLNKGGLYFKIQDPKGTTVWEVHLITNSQNQIEFHAVSAGEYTILVQGLDAGGTFDLYWQMR